MLFRILILLFVLLIVPDAYIYGMYVRRWTKRWGLRALVFLPSVLMLVYLLCVLGQDDMHVEHQTMVGRFMIIFLLFTIPRILFTIFDALGWLFFRKIERCRRIMRIVAMTLSLFAVILLCYGYLHGRSRFVVHQQTYYFRTLPKQFDGYRIALFSDLHVGTFADGHQRDVETIVNLINAQQCDAILFAGDLVNYETQELDGFKDMLRKLKAPDGVFSIMGNHDYSIYMRVPESVKQAEIRELVRREQSYGWTLLLNDHRVLRRGKDSIAIIGVENDGRPPFPSLGDLTKATRGLKNVMTPNKTNYHTFSILLSHDPTHWRRNVIPETNIDLTLSGHTHAGQFKVFGWSPVAFVYDEWSGTYGEGAQLLNVSDGVGQVMFPFRYGAWPEVNVITLKRK